MREDSRIIIDHHHPIYQAMRETVNQKHNGAFYYSKEIVNYFIPNIRTDRNWITVNTHGIGCDHAIMFIHSNIDTVRNYSWITRYKDLVLVCGIPETAEMLKEYGHTIYLPLSVKVDEVARFRCEKDRDTAFAGRRVKRVGADLSGCDFLENIPRTELLREMAHYKRVYAVGRTAIEALVLGCEILPYDPRFPDPSIWKVVDTFEAINILQERLDEYDRHCW